MIINCNTIVDRKDHVQYLTVSKSYSDNCTCSLTEQNILKAIKNATGTSVIFHINNSLIHFVFVLTSVPNVGERFTKT